MVQTDSSPGETGFGSTMHGGIKSPPLPLLSMPYLQNQISQGGDIKQFVDYYYIQKRLYSAI